MTEEVHEENTTGLEESEVLETVTAEPGAPVEEAPPSEETPPSEEASPSEEVTVEEKLQQLEAQLTEAEKKAAEYLDGLQRSQASFVNYRKRTEAEQVSWRSVANAALLGRFLPVLDDFDRAFQALPKEFEGHPWLSGITLIQRKIAGILETENVKPMDVQPGDDFDPLYHQAVLYQEVPGFEDGQIVAEVERGYTLGERVLRPSSVVVAKAPPRAPEPESEVEEADIVEADIVEAEVVESEAIDAEPVEAVAPATEQAACCCEDDESCTSQDPA